MTLFPFLVMFLFLAISQFYTPFFVEMGLLLFLPALLLLPTGIALLSEDSSEKPGKVTLQVITIVMVATRIVLVQFLYLLCIYVVLLIDRAYLFFTDSGFWLTYFQTYQMGAVYRSLQDLVAGFSNGPVLLVLIPPLIASVTISWIYYLFTKFTESLRKKFLFSESQAARSE